MSKIKIVSVSFENFKGFDKKKVLFDQYQSIILSGKNGFGKTTVFDAIELVFTGKISRYESYLSFHRQNTNLSQYALPLIYDTRITQVVLAVTLQIDDEEVVLYRREQRDSFKNPIHFDRVFNELKIQYKKDGILQDEVYRGQFGLDDFMNSYSFLNYVSQEEATSFLKSKESDRAEQINKLFNTTKIDKQIDKITKIDKKLKEANRGYKAQIETITRELSEMDKGEEGNIFDYTRLVAEKEFDWDMENPQLSYEKFNSVLGENGILDCLVYYFNHQEDYSKWKKNKKIDTLLNSPLFPNFPYYLVLFYQQYQYKLYDAFKTKLLPAVDKVSIDNLEDTISPILQGYFKDEIGIDLQEKIKSKFQMIQPVGRSASQLSKALVDLQNEREKMKSVFYKSYAALNLKDCPLCGQGYESTEVLKSKIDNYERVISETYPELQEGLGKMTNELKELLSLLIETLQVKFDEWNLNEVGYTKFKELDFDAYKSYLQEITKFGGIEIDLEKTAEDYYFLLQQRLNDAKDELNETLDYKRLDITYGTLVKFMNQAYLNQENIEKKRNYLLSQWNAMKSKLYRAKEKQKQIFECRKNFCDQKINSLKKLTTALTDYKNDYLEKVISDIEILFYVYSGRIMQENYYGRGLFIKKNSSLKRVLFVSEYQSDVDALYNLSSGQLVSIIFAFVMALNKLYSSQSFIAIDDPVQTIDDINVWGFIETIRHAFKDSFILLSTHEDEYAALLRYKLSKIGIPAKCIDMSEIRSRQEVEERSE